MHMSYQSDVAAHPDVVCAFFEMLHQVSILSLKHSREGSEHVASTRVLAERDPYLLSILESRHFDPRHKVWFP